MGFFIVIYYFTLQQELERKELENDLMKKELRVEELETEVFMILYVYINTTQKMS